MINPVASNNPSGRTDLIQLLSSPGSPLASSGLSSSQLQSILQNASAGDVVQLSDQALQLQEVGMLFGNPDTSQTAGLFSVSPPTSSTTTLDSILASLSAVSASAKSDTSSSTSSLANQLASYQSELQAEQVQALFGTNVTAAAPGTSLNVLG